MLTSHFLGNGGEAALCPPPVTHGMQGTQDVSQPALCQSPAPTLKLILNSHRGSGRKACTATPSTGRTSQLLVFLFPLASGTFRSILKFHQLSLRDIKTLMTFKFLHSFIYGVYTCIQIPQCTCGQKTTQESVLSCHPILGNLTPLGRLGSKHLYLESSLQPNPEMCISDSSFFWIPVSSPSL